MIKVGIQALICCCKHFNNMFENLFTDQLTTNKTTTKKKSADMFAGLFDDKPIAKQGGGMFDGLFSDDPKPVIAPIAKPQSVWRDKTTSFDWRDTQPMSIAKPVAQSKQNIFQKAVSGITNLGNMATNEIIDWLQINKQKLEKSIFDRDLEAELYKRYLQKEKLSPQGEKIAKEYDKKQKEYLMNAAIGATEPMKIGLSLIKKLTTVASKERAFKLLKEANVADDIAREYAPIVAKTTKEPAMFDVIKAIEKAQNTTKATKAVGSLDTLATEARKYKSAEEFVKAQGTLVYRGDATPIKLSEMNTTKVFNPAEKEALGAFNNTPGLYFTDSVSDAKSYGKNLTEVFVKPTAKVINVNDAPKILKRADVEKIIRSNPRIEDWAMNWDENFDKAIKQITDSVIAEKDGNEFLKAIWSDGGFSESDFVKAMQDVGIDGLKVPKEGVNHFVIYNKDALQTKSQLTDIWNKANKKIVQGIAKELEPLAQEARKYKSAEEFVKAQNKLADSLFKAQISSDAGKYKGNLNNLSEETKKDWFTKEYEQKFDELTKKDTFGNEIPPQYKEKSKYVEQAIDEAKKLNVPVHIGYDRIKISGEEKNVPVVYFETKNGQVSFHMPSWSDTSKPKDRFYSYPKTILSDKDAGLNLIIPERYHNLFNKNYKWNGEKNSRKIIEKEYLKTKSQLIDIWNKASKKPAGAGVRVDQAIPEGTEGVRPSYLETTKQAKEFQQNKDIQIKSPKDTSLLKSDNFPQQKLQEQPKMQLNQQLLQEDRLSYPKPYNEKTEKAIAQTAKTLKEPPNLVKRVIDSLKETKTKLIEYVQNTDERVRQLVERKDVKISDISDPYLKMTLYPGRVASKIETAKSEAGAIIKDLQQSKISRKEISDYLIARHAPERNLALGSKAAGIGTLEAHTKLKAIEASPKGATIKVLADRVQKLNNQTLDLLKESGVISDELYTKLRTKYKNHIPLNRIMDNTDDIGAALSTRGYTVRSTGIKRAVGSELEVNDILGNVISNYEQAVIRSEKNIVDQATLAFARDNKDILGDLMEVVKPQAVGKSFDGKILMQKTNDPTILQLYENGKPIWIKIKDPQLAIALQGAGKEKLGGLLNAVAKITRIYSGLATRFNPEFALPNKIRDLQETMVYLSAQGKMGIKEVAKMNARDSASVVDIVDYLKGGKSNGAKLYQEMKNLGGTTGGFGLSTREKVELNLKEMETLANSKTRQIGKNLIQYIDNWNTVFEDSTRLSVYKTALEKGLSKERAAAMAKEASINFNRMGKGGPVINALYMFSNASIQGSAKMIKSLKNPKVLGAVSLAVGGSVAAIRKFNDMADKDWRDKVSKWDRLNGLPVVVPSTDGNFRYFTIPVSWGIKPIKVMADYADDAMNGIATNATDAINKIMAAMLDAYNPMGGTDLTSALTPTALDLFSEIKSNKQWSGNQIRPIPYDKNTPADVQYFSSLKETQTGQIAISISELLQQKMGISWSPADIKYAYNQVVGGTGRFANKIVNTITGFIANKPLPPSEYPIFSRFYKERTEEEIGQGAGVETEKIKKILGEQSRERFQLKQQAENTFDAIKAEPDKAKKKQMLLDVAKENPDIVEKMMEIAKDKALGLNYSERMIKQLGVENGERAEYIASKIKEMKNKEEKREYVKNLIEKKILTDNVAKQILPLLSR